MLQKNIEALYGQPGFLWYENLDQIIRKLQVHWHLTEIDPVPNMTYHFVARARDQHQHPVILKVGYDKQVMEDEVLLRLRCRLKK